MSANDYDHELYEAIRELVNDGDLDEKSSAYGIAMQVVHQGHESLTSTQRLVYRGQVESLLKRRGPIRDSDQG